MMLTIRRLLRGMKKDEKGATAIEYGLIAALISVAIIAGATALGSKLNAQFSGLADTMNAHVTDNTTGT